MALEKVLNVILDEKNNAIMIFKKKILHTANTQVKFH